MYPKLEFLMIAYLTVTPSKFLAGVGSLLVITYYLSMLKVNVVDKYYGRSWKKYLLSMIKKKEN